MKIQTMTLGAFLVGCAAGPDVGDGWTGEGTETSSATTQQNPDVPQDECDAHEDCGDGEACALSDDLWACIPADPGREPCGEDPDCQGVGLGCYDVFEDDAGTYRVCTCNPNKNYACTNVEGECYDERVLCTSGCGADSACYQACVDAYSACLG